MQRRASFTAGTLPGPVKSVQAGNKEVHNGLTTSSYVKKQAAGCAQAGPHTYIAR